jgi:hypothetical protein
MTQPMNTRQISARIHFRDGRVLQFKEHMLAYQTWLSLPRGIRAAFRGKEMTARCIRGITRTNNRKEETTMGLTIHYSLQAQGTEARARELIHALHQTAEDLPFKELGQVVELSREHCDFEKRAKDDVLRWLLIQATESVEFKPVGRQGHPGWSTSFSVTPSRLIAFDTWPGDGCEAANFGLCQYPDVIETARGPLKTGLSGWRWSSFCKTQYASNPGYGGVPNFLRCHLTVTAMLDRAKQLGCLDLVSDEGDFWKKRDLPALVREIGSWNEMIAAFGGKLKDLLGNGPLGIQSAITDYPNFEQLEAAGEPKLPPGFRELARLIGRVNALSQGARLEAEAVPSSATL